MGEEKKKRSENNNKLVFAGKKIIHILPK